MCNNWTDIESTSIGEITNGEIKHLINSIYEGTVYDIKKIEGRGNSRIYKLSINKNSKLEVEILKGQESFKIKSFINSNVWAVLKDGKTQFKKGQMIECYNLRITNKFFFK